MLAVPEPRGWHLSLETLLERLGGSAQVREGLPRGKVSVGQAGTAQETARLGKEAAQGLGLPLSGTQPTAQPSTGSRGGNFHRL